jgi:hypothetical protein
VRFTSQPRFDGAIVVAALFVVACSSKSDHPTDAGRSDAASNDDPDDRVRVPHISAPVLLGGLVGPETKAPMGVQPFGTDLGLTFVHEGRQTILFGDSMRDARFYCDNHDPAADDSLATLPLTAPAGVPPLSFVTATGDASQYATITVNRGGKPLATGLGRTPVTAWSDGSHAFAMFGHIEFTTCGSGGDAGSGCDAKAGLTCARNVGMCTPALGDTPAPCDVTSAQGCGLGQQCTAPPDGYCVDLTCSQYDGTQSSVPFTIARNTELAVQRDDDPSTFDSVYTFASKKFHDSVARTVTRLAPSRHDDDFSPGTGALLMWGRPGFSAEHGRQSQLYLLQHSLPLQMAAGKLAFAPRFFAGVDPTSGEPRWSDAQRDAVAIAMDGKRNGSPSEPIDVVNQYTLSWLGPPVSKWIMLYGGDVPDQLLLDPNGTDEKATRGPLRVRFADWPWGPFSPAVEYLSPGSPTTAGDPYGPGGFLFHYSCQDRPGAACTRTDPVRPAESYLPGCPSAAVELDIGRLYGVNVIDAYTRPSSDGGLTLTWNVSTWNPYGVVLMQSRITP